MELASPRKMIMNAVVLTGLPAIVIFVSPLTVELVIEQAIDSPLITGGVVLLFGYLVLFGTTAPGVRHGSV